MNNLDYRYEIIGAFDNGGRDLADHTANKDQAFRVAAHYLKNHQDGDYDYMSVFDLLAHKNAVSGWHVYQNGEIEEAQRGLI